jgi:Xaa-Pro aminopeptidase
MIRSCSNDRHRLPVLVCATLILLLLSGSHALASDELLEDLKARRARLMDELGPQAMLVAFSAPPRTYSRNIHYPYRPDSNLYYLTGLKQEQTVLVLMPGNETKREILFVREPDPVHEHREGRILSPGDVTAISGIDTVYFRGSFEPFITAILSQRPFGLPRNEPPTEFQIFFDTLAAGRGRVALLLEPGAAVRGPAEPPQAFARLLTERFPAVLIHDASPIVHNLRQVKTPYEQRVLEQSLSITSEAHRAGMRTAAPGRYEYEVQAAIEAVFTSRAADGPGYPSIIGSGPNATILHYSEATRQMQAGELLLVDAAASYRGLTGDVTRTYPVSGTFTDGQKDLYRLVLEAQEAGMRAARIGNRPADIERAAEEVIKAGLLELGLITDAAGDQFRTWYTHGICHYIGMDVHDVGDYSRPFEAGMAFVIEPGLYVREAALEHLPRTPENEAFIQAVRPAVQKYRDVGVRVEDSFLLTAAELRHLSADVPRTVEEIEAFMQERPSGAR